MSPQDHNARQSEDSATRHSATLAPQPNVRDGYHASTPISLRESQNTATASPQRTFFAIPELVAEVVGYLSSSWRDIVKCLYVSRTFYSAAVPLVYKYIPLECLNVVDPILKKKHLRTVISPPTFCTALPAHCDLKLAAGYPILFEAPADEDNEDLEWGPEFPTGWGSISGDVSTQLCTSAPMMVRP